MKTWETYKEHVKRDDPIIAEDIIEIEEVSIVNPELFMTVLIPVLPSAVLILNDQ